MIKPVNSFITACFLILLVTSGCVHSDTNDAQVIEDAQFFRQQSEGDDMDVIAALESDKASSANNTDTVAASEINADTPTYNSSGYERLPLEDYQPLDFSQELIDKEFWQMLIDTPQARYMAYKIWLALGFEGNLTGDFIGIENAPMDKLIEQTIFSTPAIDHLTYMASEGNNNIVATIYKEAINDGMALGDIFYADDIEQTLIALYGDYPVADESYKDHFTDADYIEYYPDEGLFLQRFDWGGARKKPLILKIAETKASITCDFIAVYGNWYNKVDGRDTYEVNYEVALTPENFAEEAADLDVLRFSFRYAQDDDLPLLHQAKNLGKLSGLLDVYELN